MSRNLTRIDGLTATLASELHDIGITTIEQLAESEPKDLSKELGIKVNLAESFISQAVTFLEEAEEPTLVTGEKMTSKYSMKTTAKRDLETEGK
jgi:predicted RecB family nuclease